MEVDRTGWGPGPWDGEPDRVEWRYRGVPCLIVRNSLGNLCGYAAVTKGHPLYGADYEVPDVLVHGGLTYADRCADSICHVPAPGEPEDVWWYGWDAAHWGDLIPGMSRFSKPFPGDVYRDIAYVRAETERLAEQLIRAGAK